jgi:hypothetical protein
MPLSGPEDIGFMLRKAHSHNRLRGLLKNATEFGQTIDRRSCPSADTNAAADWMGQLDEAERIMKAFKFNSMVAME